MVKRWATAVAAFRCVVDLHPDREVWAFQTATNSGKPYGAYRVENLAVRHHASDKRNLAKLMEAGRVQCAREVNEGSCDIFAMVVLRRLGSPADVAVNEFADFTGPGADEGDQYFYDDGLLASGVKIPAGVTAHSLNATGVGRYGIHQFLCWHPPSGPIYFDSEAPQGVDSPFSLPLVVHDLSTGCRKSYALELVKHTIKPVGRPIIEMPFGWTRETDVEKFKNYTDAWKLQVEDQYAWAASKITACRCHLNLNRRSGNEGRRAQRGEGIYGVLGFELERERRAT